MASVLFIFVINILQNIFLIPQLELLFRELVTFFMNVLEVLNEVLFFFKIIMSFENKIRKSQFWKFKKSESQKYLPQ